MHPTIGVKGNVDIVERSPIGLDLLQALAKADRNVRPGTSQIPHTIDPSFFDTPKKTFV